LTASQVLPPAIPFDNTYARLPERFFARQRPTPVERPGLIALNHPLATELGIDISRHDATEWAAIAAGNLVPEGAEPIAMAYAGHQFGQFVPQLGDGRAILLGEVVDRCGVRRDLQLKGAGPTPFSRRGDGRAALGPVLREYVIAEAMHALGVRSTRALAAVTTGEPVFRETTLPGAVLIRVAESHVRVGTFQYFTVRRDQAGVRRLADYVIDRHYPEARAAANPYLALLEAVTARQAALVASWMSVAFIHGVMNTDNMSVAGETIDYGPCAFMEAYHPETVFSSIDQFGRYAYGAQPAIAQWNLARLAETLLPLIDADAEAAVRQATAAVNAFAPAFDAAWLATLRSKLGLVGESGDDAALAQGFLAAMQAAAADFTLAFRRLGDSLAGTAHAGALEAMFSGAPEFAGWHAAWRARLPASAAERAAVAAAMARVNPLYIPRNHLVEEMIRAAVTAGDHAPFEALNAVLAQPFAERPGLERYTLPAAPEERVTRTFCGT
jgi:uncharacterized protein YdiU (UPF0061 family)